MFLDIRWWIREIYAMCVDPVADMYNEVMGIAHTQLPGSDTELNCILVGLVFVWVEDEDISIELVYGSWIDRWAFVSICSLFEVTNG